MGFPEFATDDPVALDVEKAAFEIFPLLVGADNRFLRDQYAMAFANVLGNPGEFCRYVSGSPGECLARVDALLKIFRENADLLVGKTWVEDHDLVKKDAVLSEVNAFIKDYKTGAMDAALPRFVKLSHGIAHLLFGVQSEARDFIEYVFRIDPKLGLFFWFIGELGRFDGTSDKDVVELLLLLGVYFLASF